MGRVAQGDVRYIGMPKVLSSIPVWEFSDDAVLGQGAFLSLREASISCLVKWPYINLEYEFIKQTKTDQACSCRKPTLRFRGMYSSCKAIDVPGFSPRNTLVFPGKPEKTLEFPGNTTFFPGKSRNAMLTCCIILSTI